MYLYSTVQYRESGTAKKLPAKKDPHVHAAQVSGEHGTSCKESFAAMLRTEHARISNSRHWARASSPWFFQRTGENVEHNDVQRVPFARAPLFSSFKAAFFFPHFGGRSSIQRDIVDAGHCMLAHDWVDPKGPNRIRIYTKRFFLVWAYDLRIWRWGFRESLVCRRCEAGRRGGGCLVVGRGKVGHHEVLVRRMHCENQLDFEVVTP